MSNKIATLLDAIEGLNGISEADRAALRSKTMEVNKDLEKSAFKQTRTLKDKTIAINVLNNTISDLETSKSELENAYLQLSLQQQVIAEKSKTLEENLQKLANSYQEMEQFAYIASHDLKSPLRTISNFAQLLSRRHRDKLDLEAQEFIDFIVAGTVRMHEVICDSLEFSKVDKREEKIVVTDLRNVLELVKMNLQREIEENDASIIWNGLPCLDGNKSGLVQLFQNLVSNAIKFRTDVPPKVEISCCGTATGFEFRVRDNGIGMDETYQEKVFQPFQRLEVGKQPGTGIGLAICRKIVRMHGGEIRFESKPGQGTTFIFSLLSNQV